MTGWPDMLLPGIGTCSGPATPNAVILMPPCCPLLIASLWVTLGRSFSAVFSKPRSGTVSVPAQEEEWSRGCRISDVSFWSWQWQALWRPARPKRPSLHRKSLSSRPRPASTSKVSARARRQPPGPAPDPGLPRRGCRPRLPYPSQTGAQRSRAVRVRLGACAARCPTWSQARC